MNFKSNLSMSSSYLSTFNNFDGFSHTDSGPGKSWHYKYEVFSSLKIFSTRYKNRHIKILRFLNTLNIRYSVRIDSRMKINFLWLVLGGTIRNKKKTRKFHEFSDRIRKIFFF